VREHLPYRRHHELRDFEFGGIKYTAGVGHLSSGTVGEIFLNVVGKVGTDLEAHARDTAITVSLGLQYGVPLDTLRKALTRASNGEPGSALSYLLDQLAAAEEGPP
jgi:ribonucleoside-diphosphate reductase alpha chain